MNTEQDHRRAQPAPRTVEQQPASQRPARPKLGLFRRPDAAPVSRD